MVQTRRRTSAFQEIGIPNNGDAKSRSLRRERPQSVRFRSKDEVYLIHRYEDERILRDENERDIVVENNDQSPVAVVSPLPHKRDAMYRYGTLMLLLAVIVPLLHNIP